MIFPLSILAYQLHITLSELKSAADADECFVPSAKHSFLYNRIHTCVHTYI